MGSICFKSDEEQNEYLFQFQTVAYKNKGKKHRQLQILQKYRINSNAVIYEEDSNTFKSPSLSSNIIQESSIQKSKITNNYTSNELSEIFPNQQDYDDYQFRDYNSDQYIKQKVTQSSRIMLKKVRDFSCNYPNQQQQISAIQLNYSKSSSSNQNILGSRIQISSYQNMSLNNNNNSDIDFNKNSQQQSFLSQTDSINNCQFKDNAVMSGNFIRLKHAKTQRYLHSHYIKYEQGSKQQEVSGCQHYQDSTDDYDLWEIIKIGNCNIFDNEVVQNNISLLQDNQELKKIISNEKEELFQTKLNDININQQYNKFINSEIIMERDSENFIKQSTQNIQDSVQDNILDIDTSNENKNKGILQQNYKTSIDLQQQDNQQQQNNQNLMSVDQYGQKSVLNTNKQNLRIRRRFSHQYHTSLQQILRKQLNIRSLSADFAQRLKEDQLKNFQNAIKDKKVSLPDYQKQKGISKYTQNSLIKNEEKYYSQLKSSKQSQNKSQTKKQQQQQQLKQQQQQNQQNNNDIQENLLEQTVQQQLEDDTIRNQDIIVLKHKLTGKYLSSDEKFMSKGKKQQEVSCQIKRNRTVFWKVQIKAKNKQNYEKNKLISKNSQNSQNGQNVQNCKFNQFLEVQQQQQMQEYLQPLEVNDVVIFSHYLSKNELQVCKNSTSIQKCQKEVFCILQKNLNKKTKQDSFWIIDQQSI